jgi:hypothetical protein
VDFQDIAYPNLKNREKQTGCLFAAEIKIEWHKELPLEVRTEPDVIRSLHPALIIQLMCQHFSGRSRTERFNSSVRSPQSKAPNWLYFVGP